jgi:hypothetical protein
MILILFLIYKGERSKNEGEERAEGEERVEVPKTFPNYFLFLLR